MSETLTNLSLERLKALHDEAEKTVAEESSFVVAYGRRAEEIVVRRGRPWAESVLLRTLPRPSIFHVSSPLTTVERQIVLLADRAEWELATQERAADA